MKKSRSKPVESIPEIEGYTIEQRTIGMLKANIVAMVVLVLLLLAGLFVMYAIHAEAFSSLPTGAISLFLLFFAVGVVVHELIHGFTWMLATHSGFSHLRFGVMAGGVYCHIDVPMTKRKYVAGALMPLLLLGIIPFVVSFFAGSFILMLLGATLTACAMGDVMIVWAIRKEQPDTLVYDHPTEGGCVVYRPVSKA